MGWHGYLLCRVNLPSMIGRQLYFTHRLFLKTFGSMAGLISDNGLDHTPPLFLLFHPILFFMLTKPKRVFMYIIVKNMIKCRKSR